ncbi:MAG: Crp/Fnr family transcriptional regulator [Sphingomicrobium sp.]
MAHTIVAEISRADEAFAGNRLLSTFAVADRGLVEDVGELIELKSGDIIFQRGAQIEFSLFPIGATVIAMCTQLSDGRSVEVASVGREGALGGIISCGQAPAFSRALVLVGGFAFRIPMAALEEAKRSSRFIDHIFCRYADYLLSQVMQSVACSTFHTINQRAARWLLHAQDRAGDRLELTQEALASLLGVQRTTLNAVVQALQHDGVIATGRGVVRVTDRVELKHRACECYQKLEDHFAAVIGPGGTGA